MSKKYLQCDKCGKDFKGVPFAEKVEGPYYCGPGCFDPLTTFETDKVIKKNVEAWEKEGTVKDLDEELKKARAAKREWVSVLCSAFRMHALRYFDDGGDLGKSMGDFLSQSMISFVDNEAESFDEP